MNDTFIKCECGCGGLLLQHDDDWGLEISPLSRPYSMSLKDRLRYAWAVLRGKPYADFVILGQSEISNLIDYLIDIQNPPQESDENSMQ